MFALSALPSAQPRRRPRDPKPRFKRDTSAQVSFVHGCPDAQVREGHLARAVVRIAAQIDTGRLEEAYSALGRHGYHPRSLLLVWIYASLIGLHHSTKLARALETDAALRFLSGGHAISSATLRRFRYQHHDFLLEAFEKTVQLGLKLKLIDLGDLAIDSLRLRAHASTASVRTVERSTRRLAELEKADMSMLTEDERAKHKSKLQKHREALKRCKELGRPNIVTTNDSAALMKFPSGAGLPGHRLTIAASGLKTRMVVSLMIDASTNDFGKLEPSVRELKAVLARAGVPPGTPLQIAADAGYWSEQDLRFAAEQRSEGTDILINDPEAALDQRGKRARFFSKRLFVIHEDGSATCPADRKMLGPYPGQGDGRMKWVGDGCADCPLRPKCTKGKMRSITANLDTERARAAMRSRMKEPGAKERYNRRIGTVEPVFSTVTDATNYRRASSRSPQGVRSEIVMKLLAHNVGCLIRHQGQPPKPNGQRPLRVFRVAFEI